jgi:hypothetical protein
METLESPVESVAQGETPTPEGNSSPTEGVGEQQAETSGTVEGQTAEVTQTVEATTEQPEEDYEDGPPPESVGTKRLREYGERWEQKAKGYETVLNPLGGLEGLQEVAEPLTRLASPTSSSVDALEAVFQIAPHLDRDDFITRRLRRPT